MLPVAPTIPITSSAVDLLRQLGELADLFVELAISGGLGVTQTWPVLRVPAERFVELLDAQLCAYCMALRHEWRRGEDRSDGQEAGSAMPHSVHELCLMLNNVSWGKARLDEIARRLRRRLPGLLAIPRAELRCSLEACDETCAEMCVYLVRRIVYGSLLAHLDHAKEGSLRGLLTKLNQAAAAAAATSRPPWRLPLLMLLLGTFATALDAKLSSPTRFALLTHTRTAVLLPRHEIALLRESFAGEAIELNAAVSAALEEDLSAEAAGGQIYLASVERCANAQIVSNSTQ